MDAFITIIEKIISEQELIIGPLAIEQAQKIPGLEINWTNKKIGLKGDKKLILESLAKRYELIFGQTSIEVCKQIIHSMGDKISNDQVPEFLQ